MISKYSKYLENLTDLSNYQLEQLYKYYEILNVESSKMNLTAIKEEEDVYIKHFYDSILVLKEVKNLDNLTLLDVGSGAGFPGLVLKIVYPTLKITLLEPTKKRCDFLNLVIQTLGLKDIDVVNDRAENYIKETRESYDLVVARAVASMSILAELTLPFVKENGYFLAMKGASFEEEIASSLKAINVLGGKIDEKFIYNLPKEEGNRAIIYVKKVKKTPNIYPRAYAQIKKKPL